MSEIELAELLCDTLVDAEDAAVLNFALLNGEAVIAERTSYTVTDGDAFTDGITRKVRVVCMQGQTRICVWTGDGPDLFVIAFRRVSTIV